jgi:hypothetical protein
MTLDWKISRSQYTNKNILEAVTPIGTYKIVTDTSGCWLAGLASAMPKSKGYEDQFEELKEYAQQNFNRIVKACMQRGY